MKLKDCRVMMIKGRPLVVAAICLAAASCQLPSADGPFIGDGDVNVSDDLDLYFVNFEAAREMTPQGSPFVQTLRARYLDYHDDLAARNALIDRVHFGRKFVAAAQGINVQPDALAFRPSLPDANVDELTAARARLMAALDVGGRRVAPEAAARAQVAFDCWLREQAVGSAEKLAECRAEFLDAITEVERALGPGTPDLVIVFFAWDSAEISPVAQTFIEEAATAYRDGNDVRLVLAGHADRSGTEDYNLGLSERRARTVAAALNELGVPQDALEVTWFGESQPLVQTPDGVREPQNRRVEITFE